MCTAPNSWRAPCTLAGGSRSTLTGLAWDAVESKLTEQTSGEILEVFQARQPHVGVGDRSKQVKLAEPTAVRSQSRARVLEQDHQLLERGGGRRVLASQ